MITISYDELSRVYNLCNIEVCKLRDQLKEFDKYQDFYLESHKKSNEIGRCPQLETMRWQERKKFWDDGHPKPGAKPSKKTIQVTKAVQGEWYWSNRYNQFMQCIDTFVFDSAHDDYILIVFRAVDGQVLHTCPSDLIHPIAQPV